MSSYCQCHKKISDIFSTIGQVLQNEIKNQSVPSFLIFLFPGSRKLCLKLALLPRLLLMQVSGMTANCAFFGFQSCFKKEIFLATVTHDLVSMIRKCNNVSMISYRQCSIDRSNKIWHVQVVKKMLALLKRAMQQEQQPHSAVEKRQFVRKFFRLNGKNDRNLRQT
jgi:hypothetical protein